MPLLDHRLIARALRLESGERWRAARALGWLIAATVAVRVLSYATITRLIDRAAGGTTPTPLTPEECAVAIRRASQIWPAQCLPQAIAGYALLRRGGLRPTVTLGVSVDGRFDAHAWLECSGVTVTGSTVDRHYTPLTARRTP